MLLLDEETHTYSLDGARVPGVTELLAPLYDWSGIPHAVLEFAKERGSAIHKACELHDKGTLDMDSVDVILMPYLKAWEKFIAETGFESSVIETSLHCSHWGVTFAGTPDRAGVLTKLRGKPTAVVDIKGVAKVSPVTGIQLAAYKRILRSNGFDPEQRYAVQLLRTGDYRLHHFVDSSDDACFVAQLTTHYWKEKHVS